MFVNWSCLYTSLTNTAKFNLVKYCYLDYDKLHQKRHTVLNRFKKLILAG